MSKQQTSKFRFVKPTPSKSIFSDVKVAKPSGSSNQIAASMKYLAIPFQNNGNITILPLDPEIYDPRRSRKDPPVISAHKNAISDLGFSPFDHNLVATSSKDGSIRMWKLNDQEIEFSDPKSLAMNPVFQDDSFSGGVFKFDFHPAANQILLAGGKSKVTLFDVEKGDQVRNHAIEDVVCVGWNADGSQALALKKDQKLMLIDPRSSEISAEIALKQNLPHVALFLGIDKIVSYGQDKTKKPQVEFWDPLNLSKPIVSDQIGTSPGDILALYDRDSELLFQTLRGSNIIEIVDVYGTLGTSRVAKVESYLSASPIQGIGAIPKYSCNVMNCEIARIYKMGNDDIVPISMIVPKKSAGFHEDIFPDTATDIPAMTAQQYISGENALPIKKSLNPNYAQLVEEKVKADIESKITPEEKRVNFAKEVLSQEATEKRKKLDSIFKKSTFSNTKGSELQSIEESWYKLKVGKDLWFGRTLVSNSKFLTFPWPSVGGSVITVLTVGKKGRTPTDQHVIHAHTSDITCIDINAFSENVIGTGSLDGHFKIWKIPEAGLTSDISEAWMDEACAGKVNGLKFHTSAAHVVVVASNGFDQSYLDFWDVSTKQRRVSIKEHKQLVSDFDFSYNGQYVATTCRDKLARIFDVRSPNESVCSFSMPENLRDCAISYLGDTGYLITVGFAKGSSRQVSVWDTRKLEQLNHSSTPVYTLRIDQSNSLLSHYYDQDTGILYLGSAGDRVIDYYLFHPENANFEKLGSYQGLCLNKGLSWCPKSSLDIKNVEIARVYRLTDDNIREISFTTPRKRREYFQDDIFVPTRKNEPLYSPDEFFTNFTPKQPVLVNLRPESMQNLSEAPPEALTENEIKRASMKKEQEVTKQKSYPTMEQHFQTFESVAESYPRSSRWDAKTKVENDVNDDEW
jgi:WD40 repeat protein